ncbi:type II toxin-antitoxin system RelB family antitoxin [Duganella vulcania]|nr:hypothetical protein [Duganella vulcania]
MRPLSTSEFAIRPASPYTDTALATSELLLDGSPTGLIVTGAVLEAAVEWQGYRIAFLTDDIPFEDMLRIYMFDAKMTLVDAAVLGAMYSTGIFSDLSLQPPDALTFRFFGGIVWRVVLLAEREFALPFLSDPRGVSRKFKFFRQFRVEGKPQPEEARSTSSQSGTVTQTRGTMRVSSASASSGDLSPVAPQFATDEEAEAYDYWFRQKVQISLKDQRPTASHEEVMTTLRKIIETKHDISGSDPMRS